MTQLTRRQLIASACRVSLVATLAPLARAVTPAGATTVPEGADATTQPGALRCVNIVNFIRGVEPRSPVDLLLPVQEQMKAIVARRLPATWLLQFDALVDGPFVPTLQKSMPPDHEVGFWFEMNQKHCAAAGVEWRGRPGLEWDSQPSVAFTIGYKPAERVRLADAAMDRFKQIWGRHPSSVASWNLDAITLSHLTDHYGIDACAVCRDQIATDGFTIWGAPIAGYFPSKLNCWSPAMDRAQQIGTPIFRMLGQDPVYYYDTELKLPDGRVVREPDTMEPVWTAGRSRTFIDSFLKMIGEEPALRFAYAQLGQENNFGWPEMAAAYPIQMDALAKRRDAGSILVETLGDTGRRFKRAFDSTPVQAQVMLNDPFGNDDPAERTIWYQSRFYRANLHIKGDRAYLRDITVYSDRFAQPFLHDPTRAHEVQQRLPAVLDGFHWRKERDGDGDGDRPARAGGFFALDGEPVRLAGSVRAREQGDSLLVDLSLAKGQALHVRFDPRGIRFESSPAEARLAVNFAWDPAKASLVAVHPERADYRFAAFDYTVAVHDGVARSTADGWAIDANGAAVTLELAQPV